MKLNDGCDASVGVVVAVVVTVVVTVAVTVAVVVVVAVMVGVVAVVGVGVGVWVAVAVAVVAMTPLAFLALCALGFILGMLIEDTRTKREKIRRRLYAMIFTKELAAAIKAGHEVDYEVIFKKADEEFEKPVV